jgi:hypothetical protein
MADELASRMVMPSDESQISLSLDKTVRTEQTGRRSCGLFLSACVDRPKSSWAV